MVAASEASTKRLLPPLVGKAQPVEVQFRVRSGLIRFDSASKRALVGDTAPRLGRKSLSGATPATTGASAAGICGSVELAKCVSPLIRYLWIVVLKAC